MVLEPNKQAREDRLRQVLEAQGLVLRHFRERGEPNSDAFGEYMIIDRQSGAVVAGERYDLTLDDAEAWARELIG